MTRLIHNTVLPGLRCLVISVMVVTFGLSTLGSAMGFEQAVRPQKPQVEPTAAACDLIGALQAAGDAAGKMTPKQKPTSGPEISVIAPVMTKADNDSSRYNRNFTSDCASHQVNPYRTLHHTILPSLALTSPNLARTSTLVGARPSGTM
jgi:hypothetical protein